MRQSGAMGSLSTSLLVPSCPPDPRSCFSRMEPWTIWFRVKWKKIWWGCLSAAMIGNRVSSEAKGTRDGVWASCPTCTLGSQRESVRR